MVMINDRSIGGCIMFLVITLALHSFVNFHNHKDFYETHSFLDFQEDL